MFVVFVNNVDVCLFFDVLVEDIFYSVVVYLVVLG